MTTGPQWQPQEQDPMQGPAGTDGASGAGAADPGHALAAARAGRDAWSGPGHVAALPAPQYPSHAGHPSPQGQDPRFGGPGPYGSAPGQVPPGSPTPWSGAGQPYGYPYAPVPRLAGWGQRVGAMLIDSLLISVPLILGYGVGGIMLVTGADTSGDPAGPVGWVGVALMLLGWAGYFGVWIWTRVLRQGRDGQSVGKKVLGIRLVGADTGRPVGPAMAFARELAHILDGVLYIGYLWPLWDPQRQTFADKICSTVVVVD